ncbi:MULTISPECIES: hypothetical protein [Kluyvera]
MFRTYISTKPSVLPSYSAFCGEQHWRNAL